MRSRSGRSRRAGRSVWSVPRDLSITGYDDIDMAAHTDPPLTTVNVPALDIGRLAADHLIAAIGGLPSPMSSELPAAIVIRGSCAPPRTI